MNSFKDNKGLLWVACNECERGGNGSDDDKCSSGWKCKKFNGMGCFSGTLIKAVGSPVWRIRGRNADNSKVKSGRLSAGDIKKIGKTVFFTLDEALNSLNT